MRVSILLDHIPLLAQAFIRKCRTSKPYTHPYPHTHTHNPPNMASGAKRGHAKPGLTLDVAGDGTSDQSFNVTGGVFVKENIAINNTGVMMKDNPKAFTVCTHTRPAPLVRFHSHPISLFTPRHPGCA